VACPYFFPTEKSWSIAWPFPRRLPLGAGFCGTCRAGVGPQTPSDAELKDFCNLGYAGQCSKLPAERRADCVRFAVARHQGDRIMLSYVYEREHTPVEHGELEYDCATQRWLVALEDTCVQRQAECYLGTYLERKQSAFSTQHSVNETGPED
jgi:hypothetical protein